MPGWHLVAFRVIHQKPIWRPSAWFGHTNFFSMGDKSKILFPSMGFSHPGNKKKNFVILGGPNGALGAFWPIFGAKRAISGQISTKIKVYSLFKTFFTPAGHENIVFIYRNAFQDDFRNKNVQKRCSKASKIEIFDQKSEFFDKI